MPGKRVRITNSALNAYGTRVITSGGDIEQYRRNPVLLYMHNRGEVIGYVKDISVEGDEITGELCFDGASDISVRCSKQWEFGSLRMVSAGLDIIEMSEDEQLLVPGQTRPTITKWKLREVSVVDIGANDDAIKLYRDGQLLELTAGGDNPLPLINQSKTTMKKEQLALLLGLAETATEAEIEAKITALMSKDNDLSAVIAERDALKAEKAQITLAAITSAVDGAISERRLTADKKDQFIELGKKVGLDDLKSTLAAMTPAAKASNFVAPEGGSVAYKKLSEVPADKILELRENDPKTYKQLYEAEYGIPCTL